LCKKTSIFLFEGIGNITILASDLILTSIKHNNKQLLLEQFTKTI